MRYPIIILMLLWSWGEAKAQPAIMGNATEAILTPPLELKYTLGGYGVRMSKPAEGIYDNIKAKALVLQEGDKKFALVTLDILGLPPNVKPMIIDKLAGLGWKKENILLLPSHAHSSLEMFALNNKNIFDMPAIGIYQPQLLDFVVDRLARLIKDTDINLRPVHIGTGQLDLEGFNRNRRGSEKVDHELTVTKINLTDGLPLAVLVNWTAHPTIMNEHDMLVSGGWPGYAQRQLEETIGNDVVAMYYNGAEGDQSVINKGTGNHYKKAEIYGRLLAKKAMSVYQSISLEEDVHLDFALHKVALPNRQAHPTFMETGGKEYHLNPQNISALLEQVFPTYSYIPVLKIGDLLIVGAPGEMTAAQGMDIKSKLKAAGAAYPVIGGLANEWISYILTKEEYQQGGYEASASFYGPTLGARIHDAMLNAGLEITR